MVATLMTAQVVRDISIAPRASKVSLKELSPPISKAEAKDKLDELMDRAVLEERPALRTLPNPSKS